MDIKLSKPAIFLSALTIIGLIAHVVSGTDLSQRLTTGQLRHNWPIGMAELEKMALKWTTMNSRGENLHNPRDFFMIVFASKARQLAPPLF